MGPMPASHQICALSQIVVEEIACFMYAIRDCLVAQGRSKREAAEIRVLAVTHLRTHSRQPWGLLSNPGKF